jgi:hypothetical protein
MVCSRAGAGLFLAAGKIGAQGRGKSLGTRLMLYLPGARIIVLFHRRIRSAATDNRQGPQKLAAAYPLWHTFASAGA